MLAKLGLSSLDALADAAVPAQIRSGEPLQLPTGAGESEALAELRALATQNRICKNYLGQGYSGTIVPPVIQRNILENPGWYTAYTPYQAEISQGRMEALVNFQQMVVDLTALDIANASLLDEATAAAEAMHMAHALCKNADANAIFVSERCHPQTIAVVQTRAEPLKIKVIVGDEATFDFAEKVFAVLLQYPDTTGAILDYAPFIEQAHAAGALAIVAADILSLTLLQPPGEFGADIAVGSTQRFGVPLGFGGPHAGYMATRDAHKRLLPGRIVGVSKDVHGRPAYRLSLQTREQHIRRDKATSNICTAQVLLAVMASMYAVYHGPAGLRRIARRVHLAAEMFAAARCDGSASPSLHERSSTPSVSNAPLPRSARKSFAAPRSDINLRAEARCTGAKSSSRSTKRPTASKSARDLAVLHGGTDPGDLPETLEQSRHSASRFRPHLAVSHASRLQHAPHRARDAALHPPAGGEGSLAHHLDDPARLLHDEAERDERDAAGDVARIRRAPPFLSG